MSLTHIILNDYAKRPDGFRIKDVPGDPSAVANAVARARTKGVLFAAHIAHRHTIYFGDEQAAKQAAERARPKVSDRRNRKAEIFKTQSAWTPPNVEIEYCPCGKDERFTVAPGFVGELTKQWRQLRGEA